MRRLLRRSRCVRRPQRVAREVRPRSTSGPAKPPQRDSDPGLRRLRGDSRDRDAQRRRRRRAGSHGRRPAPGGLSTRTSPVKLDGVLDRVAARFAKATVRQGRHEVADDDRPAVRRREALRRRRHQRTRRSRPGRTTCRSCSRCRSPAGSYATYDLGFYAGKPGESEGSVRYGRARRRCRARRSSRRRAAGATRFEAIVPWSALPEARVDARGRSTASRVTSTATARSRPGPATRSTRATWRGCRASRSSSMIEQLLAPKGLTKRAPDARARRRPHGRRDARARRRLRALPHDLRQRVTSAARASSSATSAASW